MGMTRRKEKVGIVVAMLLGTAVILWLTLGEENPPRISGTFPNEAYIWQRAWTDSLQDSIRDNDAHFSRFVALGAEISFVDGRAVQVEPKLDYATIRSSKTPWGLALRIGAHGGPFDQENALTDRIIRTAERLIRKARMEGVEPVELQLDFDCPTSKLDGYRLWLKALREEIAPIRLVFTALPTWLESPSFGHLADAADGYVLQVHSLERPRNPDDPVSLCDPKAAEKAVKTAGRVGRPFRVALPTYGYHLAFDDEGRLSGVSAEGPLVSCPEGGRIRTLRSDPAAISRLIRSWRKARPQAMEGVIWYRLPCADDRLNWSSVTLREVMDGRTPEARLQVTAQEQEDRLWEIHLYNGGTADASLNVRILAEWKKGRSVAADALAGFRLGSRTRNRLEFIPVNDPSMRSLPPGARHAVGWIRLQEHGEIDIEVVSLGP